jgi:hypothetical protein
MYTGGTGCGHLSRVNAVYLGFRRARIPVEFLAVTPRSKYTHLLVPGIRRRRDLQLSGSIDVFICDWGPDDRVLSLPESLARSWVGLRRIGTIARRFPSHFHVVGLEPGVRCEREIWPIISTWHDDILSRSDVRYLLNVHDKRPIVLQCENGAYPKHLAPVFSCTPPKDSHVFRCSNAPYADGFADLAYYPIAKLFRGVDGLVLGGGYNSVHEALSYAGLDTTTFVYVGGDDQRRRLSEMGRWEVGRGSQSHVLARYIITTL